jgi:hypothetical protein
MSKPTSRCSRTIATSTRSSGGGWNACCSPAIRWTEPEPSLRPRLGADRAAATPSASALGCLISGRSRDEVRLNVSPDQTRSLLSAWNETKVRSLPAGTSGETFMRNTLFFLSLTAGLAIACASSASAVPINAAAVKEVASTTSPLQPARYRRWRRYGWWGHTKCYREFVIGPYSCHWFPL